MFNCIDKMNLHVFVTMKIINVSFMVNGRVGK
jgi:hypothetical protein